MVFHCQIYRRGLIGRLLVKSSAGTKKLTTKIMGKESQIQWTDATWNVARGCTKVDEDCKFCYMYRDSFDGTRYNPRKIVRTKTVFDFPMRFKETESKVWSGPPLLFTSSLTDVFHTAIDSYRGEVW